MKKVPMGFRQFAAWAGMLAPILFVSGFTIAGWLRQGYNPLSTYVSELALGSGGWIQISNFIILGILMLVFSRGVAAEFQTGKASKGGPTLLTIIAVLFIISGFFVMDPTGTPLNQATFHGIIHGLAGGIIFTLMPVSCFVFLRRFRADPDWRFFQGWTLVLGTIIAAAVILLTLTSKSPALQVSFKAWQGLIQRMIIIPFMLWLFLFAFRLHKAKG
jgi:hypothetical protein